ncbi:hypothetical protein ACGGZK_03885 [Agromyces sp. MMS24-K17]|uniref:hypothetical protein n=1 Tax=Agromyces sp. MMS24-K17 TaxID=3372850 RepID=UPI003753F8D0
MSAMTEHDGPSRHDRRVAAEYARAHVGRGAHPPITAEDVEWFDRLTPSQVDVLVRHLLDASPGIAQGTGGGRSDAQRQPAAAAPARRSLGRRILDALGRIVDAIAAGSVAGAAAGGFGPGAGAPYTSAGTGVAYPFFWWYGYWAGATQAMEDPRSHRSRSDDPTS